MKRDDLFSRLEFSMMIIGKEMYQEQAAILDCSPAQYHVLMVIGMFGEMFSKQLAEKLHVTPGAATQHVDVLEKAGLVMRQTNPANRREIAVTLTDAGRATFLKLRRSKRAMFDKMFQSLTDDELWTLVRLVEKVSQKYTSSSKGVSNEAV